MITLVALPDIKANLRLSESATDEDAHLDRLLAGAIRTVELETGRTIRGDAPTLAGDDLDTANMAILTLVATWYAKREAEGTLPRTALWLLEPLRQFDDGGDA
ncbi:MAG: head-tail connector protein [Sphingomonas sp.]